MKTRILYRRDADDEFSGRAFLPEDLPTDFPKDRLAAYSARFVPEHVSKYHRLGDLSTTYEKIVRDSIEVGNRRFRARWSRPLTHAVVLNEKDTEELERLDEEVSDAIRRRREFMKEAAARSRGLRIDDLDAFRDLDH